MATWQCVKHCGACCQLDPDERPDLATYLTPEELGLYLSLVGDDGWCRNFDHDTRECRIYADRPRFCRVQADIFHDLYGIQPTDMHEFAIDCCQQQIEGVYGEVSPEMQRFNQSVMG